MFDRYAGDNKTQLSAKDKTYTNPSGECGIPVLNLYSLLSAQNTPSVAKRFYGKQGREIALGIQAFVAIEAVGGTDPMFCPLLDAEGKVYQRDDKRITILNHVARLKDGIPNPKERPMFPSGWQIRLSFVHMDNTFIKVEGLKKMVEQGGILGLGTFRPIFGRYTVIWN